jgi:hypothetical protein
VKTDTTIKIILRTKEELKKAEDITIKGLLDFIGEIEAKGNYNAIN